ncbi:cyclase family protein [uncultured Clostridium sp.]|uniref:cyclase family protein n=1 Tax=uncultured Clostridium sp. TaxID=59620 RepID=UPI003217C7F8
MKIIDLTHIIDENMPVFPGTKPPILNRKYTMEEHGFRETEITMFYHTGTHIDAPAHMLMNGLTLDELDIGQFIGKAIVLDFSTLSNKIIELKDIVSYEEQIKEVDFIIIKSGWDKYWGSKVYYKYFPDLSDEAAKWIADFDLKGIGIDAMDSETFNVHKILLNRGMIVIENLTNLSAIEKEFFILSVLPLKNKSADGSPVRAIAIESMEY